MSWSAVVQVPKGADATGVETIIGDADVIGNDDCPEEKRAAFNQAVVSVIALLESGVLGPVEQHGWSISLNGHCNPGNKKQPGFADDCIGINIRQVNE